MKLELNAYFNGVLDDECSFPGCEEEILHFPFLRALITDFAPVCHSIDFRMNLYYLNSI